MDVTPKRLLLPFVSAACVFLSSLQTVHAQTSSAPHAVIGTAALPDAPEPQAPIKPTEMQLHPRSQEPEDVTLAGTPKRILEDQKGIWTSPSRIKPSDGIWLAPLGVATGLLIGSDHHTMTQLIHISKDGQDKANTLSNGALVGVGAIPASAYLWSFFNHAPQAHETGLLAGEAGVDAYVVNEALKIAFRRERPLEDNARGKFFTSPWNNGSFPSNHSILAWSMASVVASEYPGWLSKTAVYGLASTVSVSRVLSEQHFPSDVLVGSVAGWLIGRYVYHAHHNYTLNPYDAPPPPKNYIAHATPSSSASAPTAPLPTPPPPAQFAGPPDPIEHRAPAPFDADPDTIGSTNVPMDSWIYPALERLAALGLIPTQNAGIRPWTRQECLRQLRQAQDFADRLSSSDPGLVAEARRLMTDLDRELAQESSSNQELALESAYVRYGTIAGPALNDSFHFGQTWWNDFGRPQGRGSNAIAGFSTRAHYGRLFFYAREEYQHGPGNPAQTPEMNQFINQLDRIQPDFSPYRPITPQQSAYNLQRPIEMYAGVAFAGNALTFGKQELYWGPTTMGPLSFSSNAEPTYSGRFVSTRPHPLPLVPSLGTYRFDIVLGKLSGHYAPARPWYNGQKISFNFGNNLELAFTRWSVFWGVGHPITLHSFKDNILSFNSTGSYAGNGAAPYGDRLDPGDRKSNFDFRYRLPFLQRIVTLYADAYSDDDPNPIAAPRRAVWNPGIYFARLPWLPHMDLRVEAVSSQGLARDFGGQHFFQNNQYLDSNTNKGFLLGNAIGRDSRAIEGRLGYWFSSRTRIEGGYRQNKTSTLFLPQGGTISDGFVNGSFALNRHWTAQVFAQHERFLIPSYMPGAQRNTSGWFQLTWTPEISIRR
ncbi:capsule assembly Wzi family protein [Edaphobacter sp. 12200R-103]|jgi:membrane-associated phospholipid phosphatase|uniref:capsule assembly Wzi family protein n=1 Tax=Edaphobacter sp. 12200R-103 TaxID=2703788 RepID=UPI00138C0F95|nr:capsule assembly Wzi family protein [Edaphobacter sp. 12200R-103]QHS52989.1 phosphatase PAP2 family protein [Edaphobacter sp. 12200R-103]